jgi:UDP-glucose 4-epimerase
LDNLSHGFKRLVKWGPLEKGDICDTDWLTSQMLQYKPQAVIHSVELISVAESVQEPEKYLRINAGGTESVLSAMQKADVPHLLFSSTCAVHGEPEHMPITEETPCAPTHP